MGLHRILALLIVAAAILFAFGVSLEKGDSHDEGGVESATHVESEEAHVESETESGEAQVESSSEGVDAEEEETLLGVDLESTPLIVLAVLVPLALAAGVWLRPDVVALLLLTAAAMIAFALLDIREVVHQLDESKTGVALVAGMVALLHAAAAVIAYRLGRRRAEPLDR